MPAALKAPNAGFIAVVAVLVLYRCDLQDSATWHRLRAQVEQLPDEHSFRLLVCQNEALESSIPDLPGWAEYRENKSNAGLAWAYNAGLAQALESKAAWLLTLDQDTGLPTDFLPRLIAHALHLQGDKGIAAIVPQLVSETGHTYSPVIVKLGREQQLSRGFSGIAKGIVVPFNSAALVSVAWLQAVGGYNPLFWLDYLDHVTFRAIGKAGGKVWVAGDIQVEHHLSIQEGRLSMTEARFANFIQTEAAALDLYGSALEGWLYTLRLVFRIRNQQQRSDPAYFTTQTRALLRRRLRLSRQQRIQWWMKNASGLATDRGFLQQ